jgi:hypothetical protein
MSIRAPDTKADFFLASLLTLFFALPVFVEINIYSVMGLVLSVIFCSMCVSGILKRYNPAASKSVEASANKIFEIFIIIPVGFTTLVLMTAIFWVVIQGIKL